MPNLKMPDGAVVNFPDDMPKDQIKSLILSKFPDAFGAPAAQPGIMEQAGLPAAFDTFNDATTGAGAGATANFKDELLAGMASPFRAGYNALAGKGFDLGAAYDTELANQRAIQHGAEQRSPIAEALGEVGGSLATLGTGGAAAAPIKSTIPRMIGKGIVGGGGTGALYGFGGGEGGVENRIDSAAEGAGVGALTGGIVGGVAGGIAKRAARKANAAAGADANSFYELSSDAYDKLHSLGTLDSKSTDKLIGDLTSAANSNRISKTRNADVWGTIDDMAKEFKDQGATPGTLEEWRKVINSDLVSDPKQRRAGLAIRNVLDDFAQNGEGGEAGQQARGFFRQAVQLQKVHDAVSEADATASRGSRNYELHLKGGIQRLLRQDKAAMLKGRPPQFDEPMRKQMEIIANTGNMEKFMQWLGKMSPDSGLSSMGNNLLALGTHGTSLMYQVPVGLATFAAKKTAEGAARNKIDALVGLITKQHPRSPMATARARATLRALTRALVAAQPQTEPRR